MKIKNYLFRITVGILTFALAFGLVSAWRHVQSDAVINENEGCLKNLPNSDPINTEEENLPKMDVVYKDSLLLDDESNDGVQITEQDQAGKFDPEGYYSVVDNESLPKRFEDFLQFTLWYEGFDDGTEQFNDIAVPKGEVVTGKDGMKLKEFKFDRVYLSPKGLAFSTVKIKGISYKFNGKYAENYENIEGKLIKLKNNKQVAEVEIKLEWNLGC